MVMRLIAAAMLLYAVWGGACPEDPEVDLCDADDPPAPSPPDDSPAPNPPTLNIKNGTGDSDTEVDFSMHTQPSMMTALALAGLFGGKNSLLALPLLGLLRFAEAASGSSDTTCGDVKAMYKESNCCGNPDTIFDYHFIPKPNKVLFTNNPCNDKKPGLTNADFHDSACMVDGVIDVFEQAGANITEGYDGDLNASGRVPITTTYLEAGLCPVNVHWHWGAEHNSMGEFDGDGTGPLENAFEDEGGEEESRRLGVARLGFRCHHYDNTSAKFTTAFNWKHCENMVVGETYEVHWPHSKGGLCGTPWQYQSPFYDGVFCNMDKITPSTQAAIGVHGQVFTVVNDENYYYPDLFRGMIVDGDYGKDITKYTGSTTGTARNNQMCSNYAPITWQVDRKCHLISASSFDKMCADMKQQADDMSLDLHPHGSRELVISAYVADNFVFA